MYRMVLDFTIRQMCKFSAFTYILNLSLFNMDTVGLEKSRLLKVSLTHFDNRTFYFYSGPGYSEPHRPL